MHAGERQPYVVVQKIMMPFQTIHVMVGGRKKQVDALFVVFLVLIVAVLIMNSKSRVLISESDLFGANDEPSPARPPTPKFVSDASVTLPTLSQTKIYDAYHMNRGSDACSACGSLGTIAAMFPCARSVYDAGAGNCKFTRELVKKGYDVRGTEFASIPIKKFCQDLVSAGIVAQASLVDLPYKNNSFDLVTSFEVLEHVPERDTDLAVAELVRVSKGHIFATISLRRAAADPPFPEDPHVHVTVKTRAWWDEKFENNGCKVNSFLLRVLQQKWTEAGNPNLEAGHPYLSSKLRLEYLKAFGQESGAIIWSGNETEPWFFAYTCKAMEYSLPSCDIKCKELVAGAIKNVRIADEAQVPFGSACVQ